MEAKQYTSSAGLSVDTDVTVDANANSPGTPANAIVGILYEQSERQTLNSYARLIWVRHLHPIDDNCQSLARAVKTRLCSHFATAMADQYAGIHRINNQRITKKAIRATGTRPGFSVGVSQLAATMGLCQASALSNALIACKSFASPFSPQHKAIICLSASTL